MDPSSLPPLDPITTQEVIHDYPPMFRVYKDGRLDRFGDSPILPPSTDSVIGVQSKDVVISSEPKVSARLYLPKSANTDHCKLPLLFYIHGGGFVIESAFSIFYHTHVSALAAAANAVVVSVEYRRPPEDPVPACYEDCWSALKWVADQVSDPWINEYADLGRVFFAGDSAGANIAHNTLVRVGIEGLDSRVNIEGMILVHPYFGIDNLPDKLWTFCCPDTSGVDDPRFYPHTNPNLLAKIGCRKVLVCVAGNDFLNVRGRNYYEALKNSEWAGVPEFMETEGESHVFHLYKPTGEKTGSLVKLMASFIKGNH